jgi:hypothetical protein
MIGVLEASELSPALFLWGNKEHHATCILQNMEVWERESSANISAPTRVGSVRS